MAAQPVCCIYTGTHNLATTIAMGLQQRCPGAGLTGLWNNPLLGHLLLHPLDAGVGGDPEAMGESARPELVGAFARRARFLNGPSGELLQR